MSDDKNDEVVVEDGHVCNAKCGAPKQPHFYPDWEAADAAWRAHRSADTQAERVKWKDGYAQAFRDIKSGQVSLEDPVAEDPVAPVQMFCICCRKELLAVWAEHPAWPRGALCFSGGAHYGSSFDSDHVELGLSAYEIFVCDECWAQRRELAVGFRVPPPSPWRHGQPQRQYISGAAVVQRLAELAASVKDQGEPK